MPRFRVFGTVTIPVRVTVEAETPEAAQEAADDKWPGLTDYAGNGATGGQLIGINDSNASVEAGEDWPDWKDAEVVG